MTVVNHSTVMENVKYYLVTDEHQNNIFLIDRCFTNVK